MEAWYAVVRTRKDMKTKGKQAPWFNVFKCKFCGFWHIGRTRKWKRGEG